MHKMILSLLVGKMYFFVSVLIKCIREKINAKRCLIYNVMLEAYT